ncbi:MAG: M42 family metallopeptidase [Promethearchaeota archaeon]
MNKKDILSIIKNLASARAPSGMEKARGELFKSEVEKLLMDKEIPVKTDNLGNYYVRFKGTTGKKALAILSHIDEIGGTVRRIKKKGTLEFSKRGGYEGRWLVSQKIQILNKEGVWINGVIAGRSTHSTPSKLKGKELIDPLELEVYIGANNKEEVLNEYKIHIGAPIIFSGEFGLLNPEINDDIIAGYSMDNLAALTCNIVLAEKIVRNLGNEFGTIKVPYDVYIVATTREEIGTEGALFFVKNNPIDKVIGIDIGLVAEPKSVNSDIKLNDGPVIVWQDSLGKGIYDYEFCKDLANVAEKNKIVFQNGVFESYGSDAGKTQKWLGIPSALIGIPVKFSHNVPEISTLSGIEAAAELIYQYIRSLKK